MQSASTTICRIGIVALSSLFFLSTAFSQENSPFSRYGLGDLAPSQNILNRGMGGISVAHLDGQTVNFANPATFASARVVSYDLGISIDSRTLKSATPVEKYNSANFSPAYLAVALPINAKRRIGMGFGFRPLTKINYSLIRRERFTGIDSMQTLFEGTGGLNQAFLGFGKYFLPL